ncbi:SDR family NAD(P)-dependent oxidoreductase [Conexibacter stalactiti]|uniref:SDR family NAD(P)-dependent oxidoreductase n=1 Tax=Conexibacter stalactiti TaxID=1940611 RepID=A0ABU4HIJ2_9ACTN|nr:SDR family NAD(P)-dependent oxidoreductase [Conexibacter stalactiti]MDW5593070.1 SDR family NAD(P)-dependent oxidoreductase [Conexibacter stalactiti]MEC5033711.1 SDR family NAD(P)-dependent oxidoreductase [Conexibacter stalactiti]
MSSQPLEGRRVVVTGAGTGLGSVYAEAIAAAGAAVVVNDIEPDRAAAVAERIVRSGGRAIAFAADVSDWEAAGSMIEACVSEFGGIDGLVNNAGILGRLCPVHEADAGARNVIDVNVVGTLYPGIHAARTMVEAGSAGSIVNVSSGSQCGQTMYGPYGASKGAVASLTYGWARDLEDHHVRVNALSPNAWSGQNEEMVRQLGYDAEPHIKSHPSKADNAAVVVYLLSDASRKLSGQVVRVMTGQVTLLTHPYIVTPGVELDEFSVETVATAFDGGGLDQRLQPVGIAAGPAPQLELIL